MTLYHALILGLLQGLTEFLPISSSGHLVLMEHYLGLPIEQSVLIDFDVALHAGTLLAILLYFRTTWLNILKEPFKKQHDKNPPLLLLLLIATIPICIAGYIGADFIESSARTPIFVAIAFIVTGVVLLGSSYYESTRKGSVHFGWKQTLFVSIGQMFAILPGLSRSGLTLASGRFAGMKAERATEIAFLMGAPAIGAALLYTLWSGTSVLSIGLAPLLTGFAAALVSSLLVMHFFLMCIRRYGVWMWSVYLFVAGGYLLADEFLPLIQKIPTLGDSVPLSVLASTFAIMMLLEAIPVTSAFVPGWTGMMASGVLLRDNPIALAALIPFGVIPVIIGHLIGYLPARQARAKVQWKKKADKRLKRTQKFFEKWGFWAVFFGGWYGPFRPFISVAAGLGNMPTRTYLLAIISGSVAWVTLNLFGAAFVFGGMS